MDTKFWGPSGWKLLHSISYNYPINPTKKDKTIYKKFYLSLRQVLPCKYCRKSIKKFIEELPIEPYLENRELLTDWIYQIHNKVNDKLRKQGLLNKKNPLKKEVDEIYKKLGSKVYGMDFLLTIGFNYPMTDIKKCLKDGYIVFFTNLKYIIPHNKIKYNNFFNNNDVKNHLKNRKEIVEWLYKFKCLICGKDLNFNNMCDKYEKKRVRSCNKTCRK